MWFYNDQEFTEDMIGDNVGFVYVIENLSNNKKYIGKKLFISIRRTKVKDKKRRKKVVKQSDWQNYYGSNKELNEDVKKLDKENFKRTILHLCCNKAECSYLEAYEQFIRNVLIKDDYYNEWISVRCTRQHLVKFSLLNT